MSVVSVRARSFILALFIRDDGERFLLGDNGFDFKDSQLHFSANTIENDEVAKQGVDGVMLAGQVRRASVQSFDGYVGDATTLKEEVEQMRRDFIAFFAKGHHFRVIYIDCNRNAWQRKGGYLVDAPEVKELWQIHPEYHVGLNFEDVNYYEYDENAEGEEILSNIISVPISSDVEGGLVWDENGAVSEDATVIYDGDTATASGTNISISDAVEAPLSDFKLKGETSQQTYTGKNLVYTSGKTDGNITATYNAATGETTISGTAQRAYAVFGVVEDILPAGTYTFSIQSAAPCAVGIATRNSGGTRAGHPISTGATKTTFSISEDSPRYDIYLTNLTVNTTYSFTFKAMLESGSTATSFEPYVGGTPAPNPDYPQAVQTVTGENVVQICGKNLFDKSKATLGYRIGGDGTPYADSPYFISDFIPVKASTAYHINTANVGGSSAIATYDKDKVFIRRILGDGYQNIVTDANALYIRFATSQTVIDQAQLELGSTATDFEPYQGQSYEVNLGKNLFDKNSDVLSANCYLPASLTNTQLRSLDSSITGRTLLVLLQAGQTYTMQKKASGRFRIGFTNTATPALNTNGVITPRISVSDTASSVTFTVPAGSPYFVCNFYSSDQSADVQNGYETILNSIQIEKGSTATSYATYFEPVELCKLGDYQDYIYKSGDKWYLRKEVGKIPSYAGETISTDYISTTGSLTTGATVYYALATPTDTEITNEALVAQLEAILSQGYTYAGTNNITTVISVGNEQGELEITYYTKYDAKVVGGGYVWEAGGSGGPTIVTNDSISAVSPVWTVLGPALNPMLENTTTGEQIQYVGMIGEGQTLVVDMGEQTARLDGLNVISNIVGEYLTLAPGSNTLLFSAEGDAPASEIGWSEIVG